MTTGVLVTPDLIPKTPEQAWQFYANASGIDPNDRKAYLAFISAASWAAAILWNTFSESGPEALDDMSDLIMEYVPRERGVN